ncbi:MAG: hypothetical protein CM1200mP30_18440 [Pseudomonadota bacterium]|nr:MAG: hypothetical protein CM1200mP30_18440 [Pseudomonadota bacterium]
MPIVGGNITPYGQVVKNHILPEIIDQLAETSRYKKTHEESGGV